MVYVNKICMMVVILFLIHCTPIAEARPEYATRLNVNSCTACHFSPVGGGPRRMYGKLYQSRFFSLDPFLSQDKFSADLRTLGYFPEKKRESKGGLGVMSGSVAGHVALDKAKTVHLVLEHNIAGFAAAPFRDTYLLFQLHEPSSYPWFETVLVGRFRAPFGLMTDEHRTYTRLQTGSQWFTMETGILLSGNPHRMVHIDAALTNGLGSPGSSMGQGQSRLWGGILNLRFLPSFFSFGLSGRYHDTDADTNSYAVAVYSVVAIDQLHRMRYPLSVKTELSIAKGFNSRLSQGYVTDPNYAAAVKNTQSQGALVRLDWFLRQTFALIYKYDWLMPDQDFPADIYERHGLGLSWDIAAYVNIQARHEFAIGTHPSEQEKVGWLAQDASFFVVEGSF